MSAIREYCDRAIMIENGEVAFIGITDDVAQQYTKLFSAGSLSLIGADTNRWGTGVIKTEKVWVDFSNGLMIINQEIIANDNLRSPIIGFRIRSSSGVDITGTNTKLEAVKLGDIKTGQTLNIQWSLPNFLADGDYYIDPAIVDEDGVTVIDWWDEAVLFTIKRDRHLPYYIDPGFNINIRRSMR